MIFDLLAAITEKYLPELRSTVEDSRLFVLPGRAHEFLPKELDGELIESIQDNFFLPFRTIAVEDTASCIMLQDIRKNQVGLNTERVFSECLPLSAKNITEFADYVPSNDQLVNDLPPDAAILTYGRIKATAKSERGYLADAHIQGISFISKSRGVLMSSEQLKPHLDKLAEPMIKNAMSALEEVMYFNTPNRFIIENTPLKPRKKKKTKKGIVRIPRSQDRPQYTLLTPQAIKEVLRLPESVKESSPRQPHERRRHTRTFTDERFTKMLGKTIIIPATWIGPSENVVKNRRYKVRLDL